MSLMHSPPFHKRFVIFLLNCGSPLTKGQANDFAKRNFRALNGTPNNSPAQEDIEAQLQQVPSPQPVSDPQSVPNPQPAAPYRVYNKRRTNSGALSINPIVPEHRESLEAPPPVRAQPYRPMHRDLPEAAPAPTPQPLGPFRVSRHGLKIRFSREKRARDRGALSTVSVVHLLRCHHSQPILLE